MNKKSLSMVGWVVSGLTLITTILLVPQLPETVPLHWNFRGEVDGTGSRWWTLLLGALPTLMALLFTVVPRPRALEGISLATTLFLSAVAGLVLTAALGVAVPMATVVPTMIGVLFLVIAGLLPPVRLLLVAQGLVFFGIAWLPLPTEPKWIGGLVLVFSLTLGMVWFALVQARKGNRPRE